MGFRNLLVLALLAWAGFVLWRRLRRAAGRHHGTTPPARRVVKCADCGVYVPEDETVARGPERRVCASHAAPK
jgi:ribosomal protein S26